jgi:hypothetical protein
MLGSGSGSGSGKDNGKGKGKGKEKAKATASPPPPRGQRRARQSTSSPSQSPPSQNFNHPSHDNRSAPRAQFPSGFQGNRQPNLPTLTHREQLPPFRGLRDIADAHPQNALQFRAPGSHAPNLQAPSLLDQDPSALKLPPIRSISSSRCFCRFELWCKAFSSVKLWCKVSSRFEFKCKDYPIRIVKSSTASRSDSGRSSACIWCISATSHRSWPKASFSNAVCTFSTSRTSSFRTLFRLCSRAFFCSCFRALVWPS